MLGKFPKKLGSAMSDVLAAQDLIREAFPVAKYGSAKAAVWAAYRRLKFRTERRARALWDGGARRVDAAEMDALRRAVLQRAREEHARTKTRIAALEMALGIHAQDESSAGD